MRGEEKAFSELVPKFMDVTAVSVATVHRVSEMRAREEGKCDESHSKTTTTTITTTQTKPLQPRGA